MDLSMKRFDLKNHALKNSSCRQDRLFAPISCLLAVFSLEETTSQGKESSRAFSLGATRGFLNSAVSAVKPVQWNAPFRRTPNEVKGVLLQPYFLTYSNLI
ncbi:hypothetical protein AMTR_s05349p00000930 [Amborella trichopoda]|uniref:Uncharacterized protein n=1 Tax=Amborella trichopoda TaxID=13333 RepID=U5CKV0_AMBTC|nr:hypothetical protein AMTR_s05349p00000930 [Amborella trichopoda]